MATSKVQLPPGMRKLQEWGPGLKDMVKLAVEQVEGAHAFPCLERFQKQALRIGTDCSGLEAPIYGMRAMSVAMRHLWSCEAAEAPRQMIQANTPPEKVLLSDVRDRSASNRPPFVDMYVAGFSCRPFSMLHWRTQLLNEPEAEIFFSVLHRVRTLRPPAFVLENVKGIERCMDEVMDCLQSAGYVVCKLLTSPTDLGEPLHRPRYYFLGAREDVARASGQAAQDFVEASWLQLKQLAGRRAKSLESRLLPESHELVQRARAQQQQLWQKAKGKGFPTSSGDDGCEDPRWMGIHEAFAQDHPKKHEVHITADDLYLHLPRERDAWEKTAATMPPSEQGKLVVDLSQNLGRIPLRRDGTVPTVTPGSRLIIASRKRALLPVEKLILHGFPVSDMTIPHSVSERDMAQMVGNTMAVHTIAAVQLLGLCLVDWCDKAARQPAKPTPASCKGKTIEKQRAKGCASAKHPARAVAKKPASAAVCPKKNVQHVKKRPASKKPASATACPKTKAKRVSKMNSKRKLFACFVGTRWG